MPLICLALALAVAAPAADDATILFERPGAPRLTLRKVIPVGFWAKSVELTPDGSQAVVASIKGRSVTVIDTGSLEPVTVLEPRRFSPVETAFLPSRNLALISAGFLSHDVLAFDLDDWRQRGRARGGRVDDPERSTVFPKIIRVAPDEKRFFVAYWRSQNVGVFNARTLKRLALIPTGERPRGIAIAAGGRKGYICNFGEERKSITVFRANRRPYRVLRTIRGLPHARHAVASRDGGSVYVSIFGEEGGVARIDTRSDRVVARSQPLGGHTKTLVLSPDERWIFAVNYEAGTLSVLNADSFEEVARYRAGLFPQGVAVAADGRSLWTAEESHVRAWELALPTALAQKAP